MLLIRNAFVKMKFRGLIYIVSVPLLLICCNNDQSQINAPVKNDEELMELNKAMVLEEQEQINSYIARYGYTIEETKTGLRLMSIKKGSGKTPAMDNDVTIAYKISLLNGMYCYSSDSSGLLTFRMGQSTEPGGLQEGLLHMQEGGKSLMIVPSWLAYGVTGDGDKIGSNQSLVFEVDLVKVK